MGIKVITYGGKIGWFLRTHFSRYTSELYLETQYLFRKKLFNNYIEWFDKRNVPEQPCLISIETINRCNGTCDFCPANRNAESRPYKKMSDDLFRKIIGELHDWDYLGYLNLYVNNEPLLDKNIEDKYAYAKEKIPKAKMLLYTNGTLLTLERFKKLATVVDKIIINNYSETLKLNDNIKEIYDFAKSHNIFKHKDITIQIRYVHEILTNRAGTAPNKPESNENHKICILPYTDITIYPDGTCGLCCSDVLERTDLGNVNTDRLEDIWNGKKYKDIRAIIGKDRNNFSFCKGCDFVDAGIRNFFIKTKLK